MPDATINLSVQAVQNGQIPTGYSPCEGNSNYCYQFTNGNYDGGKGFSFTHGQGQKSVSVALTGASGFTITNVGIAYNEASNPGDLSATANPNGSWTITDSEVDQESGYFVVIVKNATDSGITCDPRWRNG
jgi:hypothetical protein